MTAELALALGAAAARRLTSTGTGRRPVAVVGRDPRASGEMLEAAVIAGLTSEGVDALRAGCCPHRRLRIWPAPTTPTSG
ncbi:phosphoglucomutase/phosphomannomutase, alpha/beta/alpha domain I family protein [Mycobacterium xenopi 4042]|uniref:Phosphoglucomutase/phosphomannomutase, alpha/beta/alpha domain I family protein n=1 Tax=Mycobacterium xenopi 4042 TaxID=1299334 RepID=X7YHF2_MYCXE|nr:phosphoglucomutase/phosphomannomutase, alpha/beta/alpha domain I family protein [Mycobacterium xenopi 4042]